MRKPAQKKQAEKIGSVFFNTGKSCILGHMADRYTKGGRCVSCAALKNITKNKRPRTRRNIKLTEDAIAKKQNLYVPEKACKNGHSLRFVISNNCVQCSRDQLEKHKISRKLSRLKKEYGLTKDQYLEMVAVTDGACFICNEKPASHFSLHVDHCHKTKKVRGLLCSRCNQALGLFRESTKLLNKAEEYLYAHT